MRGWTETTQKGGARRHNSPHRVHIVHTNHGKIDAHEGRDVSICDIPGDFLSTDMDEEVKMDLHRILAELMIIIVPQIYRQQVIYEKGSLVPYITLQKALYGCLRSALLLYEQIVADMRGKGFGIKPYDPRVENKMIGGKKMAVCWYVNDLKVSRVDPKEVTKFME